MRRLLGNLYGAWTAFLTLLCFTAAAVLTPANEAIAATGTFSPVWRMTYVNGLTAVTWPDENWTDIATASYTKNSRTAALTVNPGEQWILNGDTNAGILGLNSFQAGNFVQYNADRPPIIFARYSAEEAQLRITVIRVHRGGATVHVQKADFTPWHGLLYQRDRYFLSDTEKLNSYTVGKNPFASFSNGDKTDPVFYNVSWAAAQVAVGQAMQHYRAAMAFIAVPSLRLNQTTSTSGGWLKKTITTTTTGYAKPIWYVALPPSAQPYGSVAQVCAITFGSGSSCDDAAHIVSSGVSVAEWTGGTMPSTEDLLYTNVQSKSSWSVIAFALLTVALTAVGGTALSVALGATSTVGGAAIGAVSTLSVQTVAATAIAAGVTYTAASAIVNGGSLLSAQNGYLGSTGSGVAAISSSSSTYETSLRANVQAKTISNDLGSSLTAVTSQYRGACGEANTYTSCVSAGADPGMVPRTDDQEEQNSVPNTAARYKKCADSGYTYENLQRCAAGALLTAAEYSVLSSAGNVVTNTDMLPPASSSTNTAAGLYYNGVAPTR